MMFIVHALLGTALMSLVAWASNLAPGEGAFRGSLARIVWWAMPIASVASLSGASPKHSLMIGLAAWIGAWVPHTQIVDLTLHSTAIVGDASLVLLRNITVLLPVAAMLYVCGFFWFEMFKAASLALTCFSLACSIHSTVPGARRGNELSGVMFGGLVGFFLVSALSIPAIQPDMVP